MMTRRTLMGFAAAAGGGLALAGCSSFNRTIRYRLTLDVETPEGLRTGSSVVEITMEYNDGALKGLTPYAVRPTIRGEAVAVALGSRGKMFCLLTGDGTRKASASTPYHLVSLALESDPRTIWETSFYDRLNRQKPKGDVPLDTLPMLVRFGDIADPKSVARVDPNNLAASFGPGVKLARATIEITDDPVTIGIEKRIPFYNTHAGYFGGPHRDTSDLHPERNITLSAFSQGLDK